MSDLMTCSKCGFVGPNCPAFPQFDYKNRCFPCQPEKKTRKKHVEKKEQYEKDNVSYGNE